MGETGPTSCHGRCRVLPSGGTGKRRKEVTTMYAILIIGIVMLFFGIMDMIGKLIFGEDWDNDD